MMTQTKDIQAPTGAKKTTKRRPACSSRRSEVAAI